MDSKIIKILHTPDKSIAQYSKKKDILHIVSYDEQEDSYVITQITDSTNSKLTTATRRKLYFSNLNVHHNKVQLLKDAIKITKGHRQNIANMLGMNIRHIFRLIKEHNL